MKKMYLWVVSLLLLFALLLTGYFVFLRPILNRPEETETNGYFRVSGPVRPNFLYFVEGTYTSAGIPSPGQDVSDLYYFDSSAARFTAVGSGATADGKTEYYSFLPEGYTRVSPLSESFDLSSGEYYQYGVLKQASDSFVSSLNYYEKKNGTYAAVLQADKSTDVSDFFVFTPGYMAVDTLESVNERGQYLMFPHLERKDIQSLTVRNEHSTFRFYRDAADSFVLDGFEDVPCNNIIFSALITTAGYTVTSSKVMDYASDAQMAEYGLDHPRASWSIESTDGNVYSVEIGDAMLSKNGYYYARLVGRDSIYLLNLLSTIYSEDFTSVSSAEVLLQPVEFFVSPEVIVGLSNSNYYMIDNIILLGDGGDERIFYITNTILDQAATPSSSAADATSQGLSELEMQYPAHYQVNSSRFWDSFYSIALGLCRPLSCLKLGAEEADFVAYGLDHPHRVLYFETRSPVSIGNSTLYVTGSRITLYFSEKRADGTYAVVSSLYPDVIASVSAEHYGFVDTELFDWISTYVFPYNIRSVQSMTVDTGRQNVSFDLHHTTDSYEYLNAQGEFVTEYTYGLDVTTSTGLTIPNKDVINFRNFYLTLLSITLRGQLSLSEEEKTAVMADPSKRAMSFRFTTISGTSTVLDFYYYTGAGRRVLVAVDGKAEFYVSVDDIDEIDNSLTQLLKGAKVDPYNPG